MTDTARRVSDQADWPAEGPPDGTAPASPASGGPVSPAGVPGQAAPSSAIPGPPAPPANPAPVVGRATSRAYENAVRHPHDPDQTRSTKAAAVLALGVAAVITGPLLGGIVPATLGLMLGREARGDLIAGRGYLTGSRQLRVGLALAWVGIGLAVAVLVAASVIGLLSLASGGAQDFPDTSN